MAEFGSDFHRCDADFRDTLARCEHISLYDVYPEARYYASGRHALEAVIKQNGWERIWIPVYFCYEVVEAIKATGIKVSFYNDNPLLESDEDEVRQLPYQDGDVLLRMNYFGLRTKRTNSGIPMPVIEDHSHDLISDWARLSDADWCIASIRKIMPTAAGGILWSPKKHQLPATLQETPQCKKMAELRYEAMQMKKDYLKGSVVDKDAFRAKYIKSEELLGELSISGIDAESRDIAQTMNIRMWCDLKPENWLTAYELLKGKFNVLGAADSRYPFSLVIVSSTAEERDELRSYLIENRIYPAVLWQLPNDTQFKEALDISQRMLSIHCDARYSKNQIKQMCDIILAFQVKAQQ
jgi:hypothetical protein